MTHPDFNVRSFEDSDQPAIVQLWREIFADKQSWNIPADVLRRKRETQPDLVFVGELDGQIVATCVAGYDGVRGWLYRVAVAPHARRKGLGRRIVRVAIDALAALGCPKVNLQVVGGNKSAIEFYRSLGFDEQDRISLSQPLTLTSSPAYSVPVDDELVLTELRPTDKQTLVDHLNASQELSRNMLTVPYPYTESDAEGFLQIAEAAARKEHKLMFAIRSASDDSLMGSVGFKCVVIGHKGEVGYWVAPKYWNRGIASRVVEAICRYGFDTLGFARIEGRVFVGNEASARVLEKNGFQLEGILRKNVKKDGQFFDGKIYSRLKDDTCS